MQQNPNISFEEVLNALNNFSPKQKKFLFDKLRMDTFRGRWLYFKTHFKPNPNLQHLREEEIVDEVRAYRKEKHARK